LGADADDGGEGCAVRALSLTQPWAWLVVYGGKDIENRVPGFSHKSFRGEFLIHAAKGMTERDWYGAFAFTRALDAKLALRIPQARDLHRGCIIGIGEITNMLPPGDSGKPWHMRDQYGFVLRNVRPLAPIPCKGSLGFWKVPPHIVATVEALDGRIAP
jgi:hypothetical protein